MHLHQGFPLRSFCRAGLARQARQNASKHPRQVLAALGVAAQPENVVGGAAGQIADYPATQFDRHIARPLQTECIHRPVRKNPGILAASAALHRDDRRIDRRRNARQSARDHHPRVALRRQIYAQHHAPRRQAMFF